MRMSDMLDDLEGSPAPSTPEGDGDSTQWRELRRGMRFDNRTIGARQRRKMRSKLHPTVRKLIRDGFVIARAERDEAVRKLVNAHRNVWAGLCKVKGYHIDRYTDEVDLAAFPGAYTPVPRTSPKWAERSQRCEKGTTRTPSRRKRRRR